MKSMSRVIIGGLLGILLLTSSASAQSRWIYACSNESGAAFYVDAYTICRTVGGDLSMYVRVVTRWGSHTERLVIDIENRNACWPDSSYRYWIGIPPESVLEHIWAAAYLVKYGY